MTASTVKGGIRVEIDRVIHKRKLRIGYYILEGTVSRMLRTLRWVDLRTRDLHS